MREIDFGQIISCLEKLEEAERFPIKQWGDDDFARDLFIAEHRLDEADLLTFDGRLKIPAEVAGLLLERHHVGMADCDSMTLGLAGSAEASAAVQGQLDEIDAQLSALACQHQLDANLRTLLCIR